MFHSREHGYAPALPEPGVGKESSPAAHSGPDVKNSRQPKPTGVYDHHSHLKEVSTTLPLDPVQKLGQSSMRPRSGWPDAAAARCGSPPPPDREWMKCTYSNEPNRRSMGGGP